MSTVPPGRLHRPVEPVGGAPERPPSPLRPVRPVRPVRAVRGDRAMVTAETAVVLPFLVVLLALLVWVVSLGVSQVQLVDAAREGARAVARGEDEAAVTAAVTRGAPTGTRVEVSTDGGTTQVTVHLRRGLGVEPLDRVAAVDLRARAATASEEGAP